MPETHLLFYREGDKIPVLEWLEDLQEKKPKAFAKVAAKMRLLASLGHELRRPAADYLEDGIYELRIEHQRVNYRVLYFFHGKSVAVLAHALTKENKIPLADLQRAKQRKMRFESDPDAHTFEEDEDEDDQ